MVDSSQSNHPQTGQEIEEWDCTVAFLPMLIIEASQQARQTGAAVENFRNIATEQNQQLQENLLEAQKIVPAIVSAALNNNGVIEEANEVFFMRGNGDPDGTVSFNSDITYCNEDYSTEISEDVWCVRYDDEVVPAISDIELSDGTHKSLDQDELNTFSALAERLFNEAKTAADASEAEQQRQDDEEYMRNYITWTVEQNLEMRC